MNKKFDFKEQMAVGDIGENDFTSYYKNLLPVKSTDDLKYDFLISSGKKIELKTDTYDMLRTPNFFMEYYSDMRNKKLGGPWRAYYDSVDLFVYYFLKNKTFYWFETKELFTNLETYVIKKNPYKFSIKNKGWTAQGYAIPRAELIEFATKIDTF